MKMKNLLIALFLSVSFLSCNSDDSQNPNNNNPFLTTPAVNLSLSLNLPEYSPLKFPVNSVIINNHGIKGIVVFCINTDFYVAFELSDPNHVPNACSKMEVEGVIATCPCDDGNSYIITSGQHETDQSHYPMLQFRAERSGDTVHVFN